MKKNQSIEDYLEQILILSEEKSFVKSIDIAKALKYSKPSVSIAMKKLEIGNLIIVNEKGHISLTEDGYEIASATLEKHTILTELLTNIGVSKETALDDACKIEHLISDETFEALKKYAKKN